jgi:hypothetical protein
VAVNLAAAVVVVVVVVVAVNVEVVVPSQVQVAASQVWLPWQVVDKRLLDKPLADRLEEESGQPVPGGVA